ncbi:GIY-YIG nuclease family protein [Rossellomorea aquimaris]|uniref:GIY-YIG nuclease family protein n=1 Tax=Rossellomorea aquimaris TaxID=189382 RepID=UPI0024945464|nr:GIY-YIG nuclease family protein [Rossellomorea aquimaris]
MMNRESISYSNGEYVYIEYVNGERIRFKPSTNNTSQKVERASPVYILTENELNWISRVLKQNEPSCKLEIKPSYFYQKEIDRQLSENKENVRKKLDQLRVKLEGFTPEALIELRNNNIREQKRYKNFPGIYIIYNCNEDIYYIGKAEKIFDRSFAHFIKGKGSSDIYRDYYLGDKFRIHLIPIEKTSFLTLNELERNAISAYDSYQNGYNKTPGNILDKALFKNEDYEKVADLILDKIKETEWFLRLTNNRKRINYTRRFLSEHKLPEDTHFYLTFPKMIMLHQLARRSSNKR